MPKFGSPIDVAGKVFPIKQQHCTTVDEMLSLNVPKGFKTYCDELDGWYEYKGDNYKTNLVTGKWKRENTDSYSIVPYLPQLKVENSIYYINDETIVKDLTEEGILEEMPANTIDGDAEHLNLPSGYSLEATPTTILVYITINEKVYVRSLTKLISDNPVIHPDAWWNVNLPSVTYPIVDSIEGNEGRAICITKNSGPVAENGHVYLVPKSFTFEIEKEDYIINVTSTVNVKFVSSIDDYIVVPLPVSIQPGGTIVCNQQGQCHQQIITTPIYSNNYVVLLKNDGYQVYNVVTGNQIALDETTMLVTLVISDNHSVWTDYYDNSIEVDIHDYSNQVNRFIKVNSFNSGNLYEEYLCINGHYELIGSIDQAEVENLDSRSSNELANSIYSAINDELERFSNSIPDGNFDEPVTEGSTDKDTKLPLYYCNPEYYKFRNGKTPIKRNIKLYEIDVSNYDFLQEIVNSYEDYETHVVLLEDITTTLHNQIGVYLYCIDTQHYRNSFLHPWKRVYNVDSSNRQFNISTGYYYGQYTSSYISFDDVSAIEDTPDFYQFMDGVDSRDVIVNAEEYLDSQFGSFPVRKVTQQNINDDVDFTAFKFEKVLDGYGGKNQDPDDRADTHFAYCYFDTTAEAFVIKDGNTTKMLYAKDKVEASFALNIYDPEEATATTWCYIGSSEPITGTSDGENYTLMWEKANLSKKYIWRSTAINVYELDDETGEVLHGDYIKIDSYNIKNNLAGMFIKSVLNL